MAEASYPIKTFADLRMYLAADMFRYMTSTRILVAHTNITSCIYRLLIAPREGMTMRRHALH